MGDAGAWGGKPIVSEKDWRRGTEYGGVDRIIAPADSAHWDNENMSGDEKLMLIYNTTLEYNADTRTKSYTSEGVIPDTQQVAR